jgi:hypothetical protein
LTILGVVQVESNAEPGTLEYAVAWSDARHRRHLGRARVEVGLNRWRPSPAVAVQNPDGEVVVELLLGGWGAAHQLENAIASARADALSQASEEGTPMTDQIAVLAEIRPGRRADLERALAEGPPFDLAGEGFEHHEVFVGDSDVAFVFTGPGAAAELRRLAATPELFQRAIHMADLLAAPRLLEQTFRWNRRGAVPSVRAS